jgi:hypothetical protein
MRECSPKDNVQLLFTNTILNVHKSCTPKVLYRDREIHKRTLKVRHWLKKKQKLGASFAVPQTFGKPAL